MIDDSVRTGIDVIDADHAALLELLERVELARTRDQPKAVARLLRTFLTRFDRHFETENRLLEELGVGDLERRHSEFLTSRSMMASHPIDARDPEQIARLVDFARAWLNDHMVRQDGAVAAARLETRLGRRRTLFGLDRVPLLGRVIVMGVVPIALMLVLASLAIVDLLGELQSARILKEVVQVDARVGDLFYDLQEESNLAIMIVGSPKRDVGAFRDQIAKTDIAIAAFREALARVRHEFDDRPIVDAFDNAESSLALLPRSRLDVQIGSYDVFSTIEYYDTIVADLMELTPVVTQKLEPSEITRRVSSFLFLLRARQSAGAERALGTSLLSGVTVSVLTHDRKQILQRATEQESLVRAFDMFAGGASAVSLGNAASVSPMLGNMRRAIEASDPTGPTARDWTDTTTLRIDRMRQVERSFSGDVVRDVDALSERTRTHVLAFGGGLVAAVALSLASIVLLGWSLLPPLHRLGQALRRLADGERRVSLPDVGRADEIGELAGDFVSLRNRLIQGDLLEARRGTENADRLRATLESLPGIVFRVAQIDGSAARVVAASSKLRRLTGLRDADVLDRPVGSVLRACIDPEDRVALLHLIRRIGRGPVDFECRLKPSLDGRARWIRILATPVATGNGWLWDGIAFDVTMAKMADMERGRLREELDGLHLAQTTNRIAAGLGDALSRLWRPLLERAEDLLTAVPPTSPLRGALHEIHSVALETRSLAEQLGSISDGGAPTQVDVVALIERRFADLDRALPAGIVLQKTFEGRGATVLGDPEAIGHMVENLAAYTIATLGGEAGVLEIHTSVRSAEGGGRRHLCIAIRDERSDLASRTLSKVLRLRTSRVQAYRGEELSLAIIRLIADGSRGWVQSRTTAQGGSILEILLPVWKEREDNVIRLERPEKWLSREH